MKKKWLIIAAAVLVLTAVCPVKVSAGEQDEVQLEKGGDGVTVRLSLPELAGEMISSLRLSLIVSDENGGRPAVSFEFDGGIQGRSKVRETRYHTEDGVLNIYVAGTESLFQNGESTVTLGRIKTLDIEGVNASFTVDIPENPLVLAEGTGSRVVEMEGISGLTWKKETGSEEVPSGGSLEAAIGTVKGYPKENYTPESYAVLEEAVNIAEGILRSPDSTQEEKDSARQSLENAVGTLVNGKPTSAEVKESEKRKAQENEVVKKSAPVLLWIMVIILCVLIIMAVTYGIWYKRKTERKRPRVVWDE